MDDYEEEESTDDEDEELNRHAAHGGHGEDEGEFKGGSQRRGLQKDRTYRHLVRLVDPAIFTHAYGVINGKHGPGVEVGRVSVGVQVFIHVHLSTQYVYTCMGYVCAGPRACVCVLGGLCRVSCVVEQRSAWLLWR